MYDEKEIRHIIPISGKDSLCTAIIQIAKDPTLKYEFMFNPTGSELPVVFEWLKGVEGYLGQEIIHVGENLLDLVEEKGFFLPSRMRRYCTMESKIKPMIKYLDGSESDVYFGIRYDENRKGFNNVWNKNINCVYPLVDEKLGIEDVYRILNKHELKPPTFFWERLYLAVKDRLGFDPKKVMSEWVFDMLFAWRTRANCYHCFNQRQYEIVGLWEHYPELAERALWYETQGTSEGGYTWREKPFDWYKEHSERIFDKRVDSIVKKTRLKLQLDAFNPIDEDDNFLDLFTYTSCGLLCGK